MEQESSDTLCPACGNWFARQMTGRDQRCPSCGKLVERLASLPQNASIEAPAGADDVGYEFSAAAEAVPAITRQRPPQRQVPWTPIIVLSVIAISAIISAVVLYHPDAPALTAATTAPEPWDRAHRGELIAMKAEAQRLAASGDFKKSLEQYNRLLATAADHEITDPTTAEVIASARQEQTVVFNTAMTPHPVTGTATPQPAAPPTTTLATASPTPTAPIPLSPSPLPKPPLSPLPAASNIAPAAPEPAPAPPALAADNAPPLPNPPVPISLRVYTLPDAVTDQAIGESIARGVEYLRAQFDRNGQVIATDGESPRMGNPGGPGGSNLPGNGRRGGNRPEGPGERGRENGPGRGGPDRFGPNPRGGGGGAAGAYITRGFDALCVYALLQSGQALDPKILDAHDSFAGLIINQLKRYDLTYTYHRSLRAAALAVLNRPQDTAALEDDVRWLVNANREGAYTYTAPPSQAALSQWDNSNSQYGLLGVWSGAQAGLAVPANYWHAVEQHWSGCAITGGTWGYFANSAPTLSMTLAGVASEIVSRDYLNAPNGPADAGLAWLDAGDNCTAGVGTSMLPAYTLYGLERVGLASGYKYFGTHDWYSEFAQKLVASQHADGSWGTGGNNSLVDTAYSLLFLARGRHPILFNKLRYDGNWDAHCRDVMHLSRYASHQLERPLNWQVVNLRRNWFDWLDAPVLYISGTKAPDFSDADYNALRSFAEGGGLIFTQSDDGNSAFSKWVEIAAHKMFPRYELMPVPVDHPLYTVNYQFKKPPPLLSISNGSRLLLVHSPRDIARGWQLDWADTYSDDFHLGLNLFVYAAGKSVNLKHRLASTYIPPPPSAAATTINLATLRYAGAWNPEPYAFTRFARYFQWETRDGLNVSTVDLKSLQPRSVPMAVLTGTVRNDFTDAEVTAARNYVAAGGVLVIDACGGQTAFARSVETTLIERAFPRSALSPLPDNYPALIASRAGADDLTKPIYRSFAVEQVGKLPLLGFSYGAGRVVYSRLDLTTGLLGTQSWGILGFESAYAQALMKNLVLWSAARAVEIQGTARAN